MFVEKHAQLHKQTFKFYLNVSQSEIPSKRVQSESSDISAKHFEFGEQ